MERKLYVRIPPGLALVEKAGLLAKTREPGREGWCLPVPREGTEGLTSAPPAPPLLPTITAIISVLL